MKLLLAHKWTNQIDITGWWLSEKLDGVRAYWDGKNLLSRQGNIFHAPPWFTKTFPSIDLDGELYCGRGEFQTTVGIVRRHDGGEAWKNVRYRVFDSPCTPGTFEQRQDEIHKRTNGVQYVEVVPQKRCSGLVHLEQELAAVEALGGGGDYVARTLFIV